MLAAEKPKSTTAVTVIGIITLVLALVFICFFLVLPSIVGFCTSFLKYNFATGLTHSPWVGLQNYLQVLGDARFLSSLGWTLSFTAMGAGALFVLSLAAGFVLLAVGKIKWLRHALCTLLLLPLVVPGTLWAQAYWELFGVDAVSHTWLMALWCAVRYVGLPALFATAALSHGKRGASVPVLAGGAAAVILFALFGRADYNFFSGLSGIMAHNGMQSVDTYVFNSLMMLMQVSPGSAAATMQALVRMILLAAAAFPVAAMLKRLFPMNVEPHPAGARDRLIGLIPAGGVALIVLAALLVASLFRGVSGAELRMVPNAAVYTALALFTAFINTAACFLLAWPAACGGRVGKPVMTAALIVLTAMSMTTVSYGEFLLFRSAGLYNTWFSVALYGIGSVWGVWPLVFAAKGMGVVTCADWFRRMWKPALALFAIQAAIQANNTLPSLLYITETDKFHPLLAVQNMLSGFAGMDSAFNIGFIAAVLLAVPVALVLIARTAFDEKDSLALFMPGK